MDKIAIISDIHGNLEALTTVLNDIKKRNIKRIFCLGDIIGKGYHSHECIELIKNNCEIVIIGNNDDGFTKNKSNFILQGIDLKRKAWNQSLLTKEDMEYLSNLPFSYEFYMSGSLIRLFHATPTKLSGFCSSYNTYSEKYNMFLPSKYTSNNKADVVIYGHSHNNYVEQVFNRTLLNVGSVGNNICIIRSDDKDANNMEITRASYLILEGDYNSKDYNNLFSYTFVNIPYDIDKELNSSKLNFERDAYLKELKEGKYRNMKRVSKNLKEYGIDIDKL